jgi:hypothetical protein
LGNVETNFGILYKQSRDTHTYIHTTRAQTHTTTAHTYKLIGYKLIKKTILILVPFLKQFYDKKIR